MAIESELPPPRTLVGLSAPAREQLARQYAPRIRAHASRIARRLPRHIQLGELVSAGFVGLLEACARYDASAGERFDAFADKRIRGAMLDELRERDTLSRELRRFARRRSAVAQQLANERGRAPDEAELAAALGLPLAEYRAQLARASAAAPCPVATSDDDAHEVVCVEPSAGPEALAEAAQQRDRVWGAIGHLPERQRSVLQLRYDEGLTQREIATTLGVTEARVSQLHTEALARLRARVLAQGD